MFLLSLPPSLPYREGTSNFLFPCFPYGEKRTRFLTRKRGKRRTRTSSFDRGKLRWANPGVGGVDRGCQVRLGSFSIGKGAFELTSDWDCSYNLEGLQYVVAASQSTVLHAITIVIPSFFPLHPLPTRHISFRIQQRSRLHQSPQYRPRQTPRRDDLRRGTRQDCRRVREIVNRGRGQHPIDHPSRGTRGFLYPKLACLSNVVPLRTEECFSSAVFGVELILEGV